MTGSGKTSWHGLANKKADDLKLKLYRILTYYVGPWIVPCVVLDSNVVLYIAQAVMECSRRRRWATGPSGSLWYFLKLKLYLHTFLYDSWDQCDQIALSLFNIWPLKTMVICPNQKSIAKVGSKICPTVTKSTQDDKRILNCCQSDEISPNLVTMLMLTCVY